MTRPARPQDGDLAFMPARADRVVNFFERVLHHTKGRYARAPFHLHPWQADDLIRPLFGTVRYDAQAGDWVRLFNEAWVELGRGNGKSEKLAGIALYLLCADGEEGAEVYGAAADKDQAALVFNVAKRMVELSPVLSHRLVVVDSRKRIIDPKTDSVYQVIAADAAGNLGQGPHGIVFDEIIAQPSRDLYDALRTGLGKRDQPLLVCATTAGNDPESFAAHEHGAALAVAEEQAKQPNRFVYVRNTPRRVELPEGWAPPAEGPAEVDGWVVLPDTADGETVEVDPWTEANWHYANPALASGFLSLALLRAEAAAARADPTKENAFRQFRLNQWVSQTTRAVALHVWDETAGMVVEGQLVGREAWGGLDLAATTDLAAFALLFPPLDEDDEAVVEAEEVDPEDVAAVPPGEIPVLWRYWVPARALPELDARSGGAFSVWVREGWVEVSAGEVIDYDQIHEQIERDASTFDLVDVSLDPWNSAQTMAWAERVGIATASVAQTYRALSPPTKELLRIIKTRQLRHGGHPVTRYNVDAFELKRDPAENVRPVKPDRAKSGKRVDGILAVILALDGYMRRGRRRRSAYDEERGLDVI
jgi:phage terminase large subunit-like protein